MGRYRLGLAKPHAWRQPISYLAIIFFARVIVCFSFRDDLLAVSDLWYFWPPTFLARAPLRANWLVYLSSTLHFFNVFTFFFAPSPCFLPLVLSCSFRFFLFCLASSCVSSVFYCSFLQNDKFFRFLSFSVLPPSFVVLCLLSFWNCVVAAAWAALSMVGKACRLFRGCEL